MSFPRRSATPDEGSIPLRSMEGLIQKAFEPDRALIDACRAEGIVVDSDRSWYPLVEWRRAIELARTIHFPELSEVEGERAVARAYIKGFNQTLVGRVFGGIASLVGPERTLSRIPSYVRSARTDIHFQMHAIATADWRATVRDLDPHPGFVMGSFEGILLMTGVTPTVELLEMRLNEYDLSIRWS